MIETSPLQTNCVFVLTKIMLRKIESCRPDPGVARENVVTQAGYEMPWLLWEMVWENGWIATSYSTLQIFRVLFLCMHWPPPLFQLATPSPLALHGTITGVCTFFPSLSFSPPQTIQPTCLLILCLLLFSTLSSATVVKLLFLFILFVVL